MEITKIIKDQKQTRTTIPAKMVKEAGVETGHVAHWKLKKGKLSAKIMSHDEFMKAAKKDTSLHSQSNTDLNCESDEDRDMYDDGIGKSPFAEVSDVLNVKGVSQ